MLYGLYIDVVPGLGVYACRLYVSERTHNTGIIPRVRHFFKKGIEVSFKKVKFEKYMLI